MHKRFLSILLIGILASAAQAQREQSTAYVGKKIANLAFKDENGKSRSLYDLKDKKAIVLVFYSFDCPVSTSYAQPLADMAKEFDRHGVSFIGLTINEDETPAEVAKQAAHYNLNFPVYLDGKLAAARALKAETTPECFVLDGGYVLRYRGRIDNSYSERLKKHPQVTRHDLQQVLGELLSGRPVSVPATLAIGCAIPRADKITDSKPASQAVTYYRDVAPIIQNHCQQCHRPGEVGPFSLMTYKQAVNWADDIKSYTQKGLMPPWKAVDGPAFYNDRRLAREDIATLAAWVDGGTPEGDPHDAPAPRKFADGWQLGTPDLILSAESDFTLGPTGIDLFRCFVLPTHLTDDKYVAALEVRPSNPRIVHHTLQFIDTAGRGRTQEKRQQDRQEPVADAHATDTTFDRGPGYTSAMGAGLGFQRDLGGWAPGQMPRYLPDNAGFLLPKGSDIVMQVHYHRNGRIEKDRTQIGLYFAKNAVSQPWRAGMLPKAELVRMLLWRIPANAEHHLYQGDRWAGADFTLHTVMPHMHMVGKEIKVTMTPPGGQPATLIAIKEWDYNWQETYILKEPIHVKEGTRFHVDAYYDNSSKNPNNPFQPPRDIHFGEQTFNEMCFVFLGGTAGTPGFRLPLTSEPPKKAATKTAAAPAVDEPKRADEPKQEAKPRPVAYRLTDTQHVMVRVKINGKGPFNFIVDTGAPILFVATEVGKKLGLDADARGLTVLDKLEFEGGLALEKVKCRVETPFQLEGMNGMGLAGVELHGILGYTVLANFRMEFDFTKDAMRWTPLDWKPPPPQGIGGKGGQGGLEILGTIMKFLGPLMGLQQAGPPERRGFLGVELADKEGAVMVSKVLADSPAAGSGLQAGDRLQEINGKEVKTSADVHRLTATVLVGQLVRITVQRGDNKVALKVTAGEGL
jgi:peroxiredoxin/mono/diheme cytochrome c family protein